MLSSMKQQLKRLLIYSTFKMKLHWGLEFLTFEFRTYSNVLKFGFQMEKKVWFSNFISLDRFIYIEKISFHQKRPRLEKNGYTIQWLYDYTKTERHRPSEIRTRSEFEPPPYV